ncbi:unnamed protein product [Paramecium sonneborni]|uniref:C2H2-type domain-containing protein n=1 Tax=Paramecium sonneborni TaxID=65129 RepID=A0A8S1NXQ4_9CILI|nr:unnamed protein product [Paramecium sonneborni]
MIIEEIQNSPQNNTQIISTKEQYLSATNQLIEMFKKKLSLIQKEKQPNPHFEKIDQVKQLCNAIELEKQMKNKDQFDIQSQDILEEYETQKQNKIIQTSSRRVYQCSCHNKKFKTPQQLGGHLKWRKFNMIQQNKIQ